MNEHHVWCDKQGPSGNCTMCSQLNEKFPQFAGHDDFELATQYFPDTFKVKASHTKAAGKRASQ